jgi:hypothetical protein
VERNAVTVWFEVDEASGVCPAPGTQPRLARTRIVNGNKTTYTAFGAAPSSSYMGRCRALLEKLSQSAEPEEQIAWAMIRYNAFFGRALVDKCAAAAAAQASKPPAAEEETSHRYVGLLRAQTVAKTAALYTAVTPGALTAAAKATSGDSASASFSSSPSSSIGPLGHLSLGLEYYAHASSPIRRFSDLINQHAAFGTLDVKRAVAPPATLADSSGSGGGVAGALATGFSNRRLNDSIAALNARYESI